MISSVQSLSRVQLFATPWTAARQASLSITNSQSLLKLMSIEYYDKGGGEGKDNLKKSHAAWFYLYVTVSKGQN